MSSPDVRPAGPQRNLEVDGCHVLLLGTAHVSRASAEEVAELIRSDRFDAVAIELCQGREQQITQPELLERMDLFQIIRQGKAPLVMASLALSAYQQRLAERFGIEPGAEMRMAIQHAQARQLPLLLIDRDVGITLRRTLHAVPWWQRMNIFSGLVASLFSRDHVDEAEIEQLKREDALARTFAQFSDENRALFGPLIEERDRYMVAAVRRGIGLHQPKALLVVVGAGHLDGMVNEFANQQQDPDELLSTLDQVPPSNPFWRLAPWLIAALVLTGFAIGFSRNSDLGWQMVSEWVLINGGLSALGTLLALGHPLTVLGAFVAAPLTSLNPTIGAGMVTAALETWLRKPTVGDFHRLRRDAAHPWQWWRNRVTRILLVFLFSTLGSAAGTWIAGIRVFNLLS